MCGASDFIKKDGMFVCECCGAKYAPEEAKKLLLEVEGTVDVSGSTVKVDNTSKLENLYAIARRAKNDNNTESAQKYYDLILQEDPTSWEASFYSTYYSAMQTNIAGIASAATKVSNTLDTTLMMIRDHVPENEQRAAVDEMTARVISFGRLLASSAKNHYDGINYEIRSKYTGEYNQRILAVKTMLAYAGNYVDQYFPGRMTDISIAAWKSSIAYTGVNFSFEQLDKVSKDCISKYDPEYKRQHLKNQIASLDKQIGEASAESTRVRFPINGLGIFIIILAVFFLGSYGMIVSWGGTEPWILWVGIGLLVLGIFVGRAGRQKQDEDSRRGRAAETAEKLVQQKLKLQKELNEMEGK